MYYVYLLKCIDNSLYCGITTDLQRRLTEHNTSKKGAKYTKSRRPVTLMWFQITNDKSSALKLEFKIKNYSRQMKIALCNSPDNPVLIKNT
jgi:putative endonuclease